MNGEDVESRIVTSGTNCVMDEIFHYTDVNGVRVYYYTNSTSNYINNIVYYKPEEYTYTKEECKEINIFPFIVKLTITLCQGNLGSKYKTHVYEVFLGDREIKRIHPGKELNISELEEYLQDESKKWLDSQMISTWKTS